MSTIPKETIRQILAEKNPQTPDDIMNTLRDTVYMPEGVGKIHPFLAAVLTDGAVEVGVYAGISLVKEGDEIVFEGSFVLDVEVVLPIHGFQLVARRLHGSMFAQFGPVVKSISGDLQGAGLIGFDLANGIVAIFLDEQGINRADEESGFVKHSRYQFAVPADS